MGLKTKHLLAVTLVMFASCGSFSYKWYGMQLPDYTKGKLLAEDEADDLPMSVCKPDQVRKGKCVVMLIDEFEKLKADYEVARERLKQCEKDR